MKVFERNYMVLVMKCIRHGNVVLVDIGRIKIFLHALYFSPYLIPLEFDILKIT